MSAMQNPRVRGVKCSAFLAASLDGFIADEHGSIEWLEELNRLVPAGEDCGYSEFSAQVDALVMGRNTFQQVLRFPEWPYRGKTVFVLSTSISSMPAEACDHAMLLNAPPSEVVGLLEKRGHKHLYIDGGATIQGFLAAGLLDEITITHVPIALGRGTPLFGPESGHVRFELMRSRSYPFGFVQNTYRVAPAADNSPARSTRKQ